jgi:hypothetical protein
VWLDWRNHYITVEKFAEHNGLLPVQARVLLEVAATVFHSPHPEA